MTKGRRLKVIRVTPTQVKAAQDQLERDRLLGRRSDPAVKLIANAKTVAVKRVEHPETITVETVTQAARPGRVQDNTGIDF